MTAGSEDLVATERRRESDDHAGTASNHYMPNRGRRPRVPTIRPHDSSLPGDRAWPAPVELLLGGTWLAATAHAVRNGRRGPQVLVGCHGRLVWVSASRIRRSEPSASQTSQSKKPPPAPRKR